MISPARSEYLYLRIWRLARAYADGVFWTNAKAKLFRDFKQNNHSFNRDFYDLSI